jgi:hypothetical protein
VLLLLVRPGCNVLARITVADGTTKIHFSRLRDHLSRAADPGPQRRHTKDTVYYCILVHELAPTILSCFYQRFFFLC